MSGDGGQTDEAVTEDAFLGGALRLRQPAKGYRAGVDAVLLAAAAPIGAEQAARVLDLGAGVGTVGLCIAQRCRQARIVLVERQAGLAALAEDNARRNGLQDRVTVLAADIADRAARARLPPHAFDHVLANPPFHDAGRGTPAGDAVKAASHAMASGDLESWVRLSARCVIEGGTATLIHKAEALGLVLAAMQQRFGALRILPVAARAGAPAIRIIVQGVRGSRAPLTLLAPLLLHRDEGHGFTAAAEAILKHGAALSLER